jgi:GT2 family glycosyltransferase
VSGPEPIVSVVVATRNRGHLIEDSIRSVLAGTEGVAAEAIYVDDASTDDTAARLAAWGDKIQWRTAENCRAPGLARNVGAALARGEHILFTDDDCVLPPNWARDMLALRERHGCDALSGGFKGLGMDTPAERYAEYRHRINFGPKPKPIQAAPMMCFLVRRQAFEAVGGFAPKRLISMEDYDLCYRLRAAGYSLHYDPAVTVGHQYQKNWQPIVRRLVHTAWTAPRLWRSGKMSPAGKLAKDTARGLGAPLWCLRYFPLGLYPQAVGLEFLYFAVRVGGVAATLLGGEPGAREQQQQQERTAPSGPGGGRRGA